MVSDGTLFGHGLKGKPRGSPILLCEMVSTTPKPVENPPFRGFCVFSAISDAFGGSPQGQRGPALRAPPSWVLPLRVSQMFAPESGRRSMGSFKRVPPVPRLGISPGLTLDGVASHGLGGGVLGCAPPVAGALLSGALLPLCGCAMSCTSW